MSGPADIVLDLLLRAVALFYAAGSFFGMRRIAMDAMLDRAIAAIGASAEDRDPQRQKLLRARALFNMTLLAAGGVGGLLVAAMIGAGAAVVTAVALLNGLNLFWLAPRYFDAVEPPDAQARQNSYKAAVIYALFALVALFQWRHGRMTALAATHPAVLAATAFACLALLAHAWRAWSQSQSLAGKPVPQGEALDDAAWQARNAAELESLAEERRQDCARYDGKTFVFNPAMGSRGSPFVVAGTGERLPDWPPISELDETVLNQLYDLSWSLEAALDPHDPRRQNYASVEARDAFLAEARTLYHRAREKIGADRLSFDATLAAHEPSVHPARIILKARSGWGALMLDGDEDKRSWGADLGLSLRLETDIANWAADFADACPRDEIENSSLGPPPWDAQARAAFDERGRALTVRLRQEFAATGRAAIAVDYETYTDA